MGVGRHDGVKLGRVNRVVGGVEHQHPVLLDPEDGPRIIRGGLLLAQKESQSSAPHCQA